MPPRRRGGDAVIAEFDIGRLAAELLGGQREELVLEVRGGPA